MNDAVCHDSVAAALPHTVINLFPPSQSSTSSNGGVVTQPVILNSMPDMSYITGELLTCLKSLLSGWEARLSSVDSFFPKPITCTQTEELS